MNYNKKGIRKVAMAIRNTTERKEWLDATITTLQQAVNKDNRQVDIECLEECKRLRSEMASPYGMLNNLRRN